ncbi:MAG TPA: hypothetical protein VIZ19_21020, partial [Roseiarcus sp.]
LGSDERSQGNPTLIGGDLRSETAARQENPNRAGEHPSAAGSSQTGKPEEFSLGAFLAFGRINSIYVYIHCREIQRAAMIRRE